MNHSGEDLLIYRRGKKLLNQLWNSQVLVTSRTAWGRISGETPSRLYIARRKTSAEGANPLF